MPASGLSRGEEALRAVAQLALEGFADWMVADALVPGGLRRVFEERHGTAPRSGPLPRRLLAPAQSLAMQALSAGRALLDPNPSGEADGPLGPRVRRAQVLGACSIVVAPLMAGKRPLGALTFGRVAPRRPYGERDRLAAETLARQVALAVDHDRLLHSERIAREMKARETRRLDLLERVTASVAEGLLAEQILRLVLERSLAIFAARQAAAWLVAPGAGALELVDSRGYPAIFPGRWRRISLDSSMPVAEAIRRNAPVHIELGPADLSPKGAALADLASFLASYPLQIDGTPVGALALTFESGRQLDDSERSLLEALARQCSLALENARLRRDLRREREALEVQKPPDRGAMERAASQPAVQVAVTDDEIAKLAVRPPGRPDHAVESTERRNQGVLACPTVRALVDACPLAVALIGLDGAVLAWNPAAESIFGWTEKEVLGRLLPPVPEDRLEEFRANLRQVAQGRALSRETKRQTRSGRRIEVSLWAAALPTPEGCCGLWIMEDITERRRTRQALRRSAQRSRALAEASKALSSTRLDARAPLEVVTRAASETPGDGCVLALLDAAGEALLPVAAAHCDPAAEPLLAQALDLRVPTGPLLRELLTRNSAVLLHQLDDEDVLAKEWPSLGEYHSQRGVASCLLAPLRIEGHAIGILAVSRDRGGTPYQPGDAAFLQELADRAALAITNARLYDSAQAAVRIREDFLSIAGHELRTPLTALELLLFTALRMLREEEPSARVRERMERAARELDRMKRLVDQLLDVSRIAAGRLALEREELDLAGLADEVVTRHADTAGRAGCALLLHATGPVVGCWDRGRMEQVASNLVANAVKYGQGRPIEVRVERAEDRARLSVRDQGIGIAPEDQARIFERFERADSVRHFGGLGLGLWITRQIVQAHGGMIRVDSAPGCGSLFTVELPLRQPRGEVPP